MPAVTVDPSGYLSSIPRGVFRREDVFRELICNAIQACDLAEQLDPDMKPTVTVTMPGGKVVVEDNGIGFHPAVLDQLGNFQASKWRLAEEKAGVVTRGQNSTGIFGMGLASLYLVAEAVDIQTLPLGETPARIHRWWTDWRDWFKRRINKVSATRI